MLRINGRKALTAPLQVICHGSSTVGRALVHEEVLNLLGVGLIQDALLYPELDEVLARFDRSFSGRGDVIKFVLIGEEGERVIPECIGLHADYREGRFMTESGRAMPVNGVFSDLSVDFK